jgi:transposase
MFRENVTMENLTLNQWEQNRLRVPNEVNLGKLKIQQAAILMELSLRHAKRLLAEYRQEGAKALAHGNGGRLPFKPIDLMIRAQVAELSRSKYCGFNQQHFSEKLSEQEGIPLSRSTVRRILLKEGIASRLKEEPPGIVAGASVTLCRACYFRPTAARMIDWKTGAPGYV